MDNQPQPEPQMIQVSRNNFGPSKQNILLGTGLFFLGLVIGVIIDKNFNQPTKVAVIPGETQSEPTPSVKPEITIQTNNDNPQNPPGDSQMQPTLPIARKVDYSVPQGWIRITDLLQNFEVAYDPEQFRESTVADKRIDLVQIIDPQVYRTPARVYVRVFPYTGGSRHLFIYKWANGGIDTTKSPFDTTPDTREENLVFNDRSCLMIENVYISMSEPTWLMCDIGGGEAIFINSTTDLTLKTLATFSTL